MKPLNHVLTTIACLGPLSSAIPLGVTDVPVAITGTLIPYLGEKAMRRKERGVLHSVALWGAVLVLLGAWAAPKVGPVHLWALPLGALLHILFDALSDKKVPLLINPGRGIAFSIYEEDDISEETFTWFLTLACLGLWFWKHR